MSDGKHIGAVIPQEVHNKLVAKAKKEDLTLSQVLRRLVKAYVQDCKPKEATTQEQKQ